MMPQKRFLNVLYENQSVDIETGRMERFSELQKEVLLAFKETTLGYARVQLWNKRTTSHTQLDKLEAIEALSEEFYWESKKPGALFLTVQLHPFPLVSSDDTVSLSVQGSLFVLKRKTVLSFDWMVARMLTSALPLSTHNDMIYVDVDSTSFRMILSILQGLTDFQLEVSRISKMELTILKATAAYLLCDDIVRKIEDFETELQKLESDRDNLIEEIQKLEADIDKLVYRF